MCIPGLPWMNHCFLVSVLHCRCLWKKVEYIKQLLLKSSYLSTLVQICSAPSHDTWDWNCSLLCYKESFYYGKEKSQIRVLGALFFCRNLEGSFPFFKINFFDCMDSLLVQILSRRTWSQIHEDRSAHITLNPLNKINVVLKPFAQFLLILGKTNVFMKSLVCHWINLKLPQEKLELLTPDGSE